MKIGVVGDTHIPQATPLLPARITEVFRGLDIILHVGDICELYVLEELQETFTLTFAVWGESDSEAAHRYLDEKRIVSFGERRVGMIHGHQFEAGGRAFFRRLFRRKAGTQALSPFLLEQFAGEGVDAIICGHTHRPQIQMHNGVLIFNPGAAVPGPGYRPSVGILEIEKRKISGQIVSL